MAALPATNPRLLLSDVTGGPRLRRSRPRPSNRWHLDEMVVGAAAGSLMTLCWREPDSNCWSHLQRGQPYPELGRSFFAPSCTGCDRLVSENADF
jgi:hypothetical protein